MANNTLLASDNFASGSALERKRARSREWARKFRENKHEEFCARQRAWRKAHPEQWQAYNKKRRADPLYSRKTKSLKVRKVYGITLEEYEARLAAQDNLCALCREPMDVVNWNTGRSPAMDHNHENGQLREFLHQDCNRGLGAFGDSPQKLRWAADYLEKHNGQ